MRLLLALGTSVLALATAFVVPAGASTTPLMLQSQVSNPAPLPCIGANPYDGVVTFTATQQSSSVSNGLAQLGFGLTLSYAPNDITQPTWSGTQQLNTTLNLADATAGSTIPFTMTVTNPTGAAAALTGALYLTLDAKGAITSISNSTWWTCSATQPTVTIASVPGGTPPFPATCSAGVDAIVSQVLALQLDRGLTNQLVNLLIHPGVCAGHGPNPHARLALWSSIVQARLTPTQAAQLLFSEQQLDALV